MMATGSLAGPALGPAMLAMTLLSGPASPWGVAFTQLADATAWSRFGWDGLLNLPDGPAQGLGTARNGGSWSALAGLTNGGLGAAVPMATWDPRRAWATPAGGALAGMSGGLSALESPPGWGNKGWGPTSTSTTGTWGQTSTPGMYNLSRGAADVSGWGLDNGFFTIPQEERRRQMDTYLQQVNTSPNGVPGAGQTRLDQSKFPYLRPVKGPLVPDK
jgi:hypothetical protein